MTNSTVNLPDDPHERLAAITREFGEYGGVNASIEPSVTYTVFKSETLADLTGGKIGHEDGCYAYSRHGNPTVLSLGRQIAAMEGAEAGYCTSSGLSAINLSLLAYCDSGDHIVTSDAIYGGTHAMLHKLYPKKFGISCTPVPVKDLAAVEAAIRPNTRVIYTETLSNPTLVVADIPRLAEIARRHGIKLIVDNTFTPMIVSPIRHGADVVVHSVTKFISGSADIIAGAAVGTKAFVDRLLNPSTGLMILQGPIMDPKTAADLALRLPHLALRLREHSARAAYYAERLAGLGARVIYPGLTSHPQHELFASLCNPGYGSGGMLAVDLRTSERAAAFLERLQNKHAFGLLAVSLGYFDTLMSASAGSTAAELSDAELEASGISRGLVRMSIGFTGGREQRWAALEESYRAVTDTPPESK